MKSDKLNTTIDMIVCMAIKDLAAEENISEDEARDKIMSSNAIDLLYDSDNELWSQGPDAFIEFVKIANQSVRALTSSAFDAPASGLPQP